MIEFENVSFRYRGKRKNTSVKDLNFHIKKGETILLCGESGCGKSTVTRLMNGLIPHFYQGCLTGTIKINGMDIKDKSLYEINEKTGSVFQNPRTQFFNLDTDGELVFGLENRGYPINEILEKKADTIERFSLKKLMKRNIHHLSGGEQQKIACASIYCSNPEVYVFDEPTSNLDEYAISEFTEQLQEIKAKGKTIIIAEHRLYFLSQLVDRVFYMQEGSIVAVYNREEFLALPIEELNQMGLRTTIKPSLKIVESQMNKLDLSKYLEVKNCKTVYKERNGKKNKSICVENVKFPIGEITAIVGDNGVGKSTLARAIAGLSKSSKAEIFVARKKVSSKRRVKLSYFVMQDVNHQLFTESVKKEMELSVCELSDEERDTIMNALDLASLATEHPMNISGGQKQRVAIASAISSGKQIIVLDEPTSGLDYRQMKHIVQALRELQKSVDFIIVISHDVEFINLCCTNIVKLERRIIESEELT